MYVGDDKIHTLLYKSSLFMMFYVEREREIKVL